MPAMTRRLEGKSCVVTGAGRGIGRAVALAFGEEGARVVVNDLDDGAADAVVKEITASDGDAVANYEPILRDKMLHNMSEEDFDAVVQVHLKGTWACGRAFVQHWRPIAKTEVADGNARHRKIVNVTSASGLIGSVGQSNYSAAKMGIVGLTKTWAKELGGLSINVNAVAPAALTAMTEPLLQDEAAAARRLSRFALGRYGDPEEIAPAFVFLASPESDYVTGQILCVDGGLVI
jgi:3-oxoacyl-[acyl-carrier protein] reductase